MAAKTKPVKRRESNEEFLAARVRGHGGSPPPTERALATLLDGIKETDGAEIPRSLWPEAEMLVARGLITLGAPRGPSPNWRRAELVPEKRTLAEWMALRTLHADALKLVEQLALCWIREGSSGDEPGSAKEAYMLLTKHGYGLDVRAPGSLCRPDGSVVVRNG